MSSIGYVCDNGMLEYHRICGHQTINFWRPSKGRKFESFAEGDLLFFLSKQDGHQRKEKGIVGYGRLVKLSNQTVDQMWKRHKQQNGYETKPELINAIIKANKNNVLPESLSCLWLKDVVFFQQPVYLSDLGISLSKGIESYFYLDRLDSQATEKVLSQASNFGIDSWQSAINEDLNQKVFYRDRILNLCAKSFSIGGFSPMEIIGLRHYCESHPVDLVIPKNALALTMEPSKVVLYCYFLGNQRHAINVVIRVRGLVAIYQKIFNDLQIKGITLEVIPVIGTKLSESYLAMIPEAVVE